MRSRAERDIIAAGCGDQDAVANPVLAAVDIASVGLIAQLAAEIGGVLGRELGREQLLVEGLAGGQCLVVGQRVQQKRPGMVDIILGSHVSPTRAPAPRKVHTVKFRLF